MTDLDVPGYPTDRVNNGNTDKRRECILEELATAFPSAATAERIEGYIFMLKAERFKICDVREGVQRNIHVREATTFPPYAELRRHCGEARALRVKCERLDAQQGGKQEQRDLTDTGIARDVLMFQQWREVDLPRGGDMQLIAEVLEGALPTETKRIERIRKIEQRTPEELRKLPPFSGADLALMTGMNKAFDEGRTRG